MSGLSLDDAKDAAAEAQQGNLRENDAGIAEEDAIDYQEVEAPMVRVHPECLISFDRIAGYNVFNTSDEFLDARQNLENAGPRGYGNQVVITLENPVIESGQLWKEEHDFRDYRVLGDPNSDNSPYSVNEDVQRDEDGNVTGAEITGVDLGMGEFEGQPDEDNQFDTQYVQLLVSARRAGDILGALDTAGKWSHNRDGELVEGILEAPPNLGSDSYDSDEDGAPRAIGYPELRSDMVDQKGAISWTFNVGADETPTTQSAVQITIYKVDDDGGMEALVPLTPEDEAYALPTYPRGGRLFWEHEDDGSVEGSVGADAEPETTGGIDEVKDELSDDVTYSDLSEETQGFVDEAAEALAGADTDDIDDLGEHTLAERVSTSDVSPSVDTDDLRDVINGQA